MRIHPIRKNSWLVVALIALVLLFSSALFTFAQDRIDCSAMPSKILRRDVRYCVEVPASYDQPQSKEKRYPILYMLHGLGDDEQTLFKTGGWTIIEDLRKQGKIGDFLVVAPDGDRTFYINSADRKVQYSDFFLKEFMPAIEKKYRVLPGRAARGINGISMGGYGALRFAFARPDLFSSVSAQSAALMLDSPADLNAAMKSDLPIMQTFSHVFGNPVDEQHWEENDPFSLARKNVSALRKTAIYFNCGNSDDYGFDKGAAALDKELTKLHLAHEYHAYPGGHTFQYFLSHMTEAIEFHWKTWQQLSPQ
jgi:S-formylglutathione hydrolase FrmB